MKVNFNKAYQAIYWNEKIPRKAKKVILGRKMKRTVLKKLLASVKVIIPAKTMFESPIIEPFLFCPNCGCREYYGTGNKTAYPEHWEYFHCLKCRKVVAYIDNSPFIHALECEDYDPVF